MPTEISINTDLGNCVVFADGPWFMNSNIVYETIQLKDSNKSYILSFVVTKEYDKFMPRKKGLLHLISYAEYVAVSDTLANLPELHGMSIAFNVGTYLGGLQPTIQYHDRGRNISGRLQRSLEKVSYSNMPWTEQIATAILISEGFDINTSHIPDRLKVHTPYLSGCYDIEPSSLEKYHRILTMAK